MKDVFLQQSDDLVRRVVNLTEEKETADTDRKQLIDITGELFSQVDSAEARIARRPDMELNCQRLQAGRETLDQEDTTLRRSNAALCQQVLSEDSETALSGA